MIRDPSDGTVREEINPQANKINTVAVKPAPEGIIPDTGLRQPTRTDAQERMERSREWIRDYHAKNGATHAGADIEQSQHSEDGRAGDHQGQAEPALRGGDGANR